jgi:hypothetical protein
MEVRHDDIESTVTWLDDVGLAGPAYVVLHGLRPLSFVGGQGLLFLQPLLPLGKWRSSAERLAGILADRPRLDSLLTALEGRLARAQGRRGKEEG